MANPFGSERERSDYIYNYLRSNGVPHACCLGVMCNLHRKCLGVAYPFEMWMVDTGPQAGGGIRGLIADSAIGVCKRFNVGSDAIAIIQRADSYARRCPHGDCNDAAHRWIQNQMGGVKFPIPPEVQMKNVLKVINEDTRLLSANTSGEEATAYFRKLNNPGLNDQKALRERWHKHGQELMEIYGSDGSGWNGSMNSGFVNHEWPDFNLKSYPIYNDANGRFTNEPILMGIANHLHINVSGGGSGMVGGDPLGGGAFSGEVPYSSPEDFINKVNWEATTKYEYDYYSGKHGFKYRTLAGKIRMPPADWLSQAKSYSQRTGVPLEAIWAVGQNESGFKNHPKNNLGYGGYFGSKYGPEGSFDEQAESVRSSFNNAKSHAPGCTNAEALYLMYMWHHLPAVGSKYWQQTGGKIWSPDPDYIIRNATACYGELATRPLRRAEHLAIQLKMQYMICCFKYNKIV